jgi:hypothetical protein
MTKTILYVRTTARTSPGTLLAGTAGAAQAIATLADLDMTKEVA